jgi:hypothetical protein
MEGAVLAGAVVAGLDGEVAFGLRNWAGFLDRLTSGPLQRFRYLDDK